MSLKFLENKCLELHKKAELTLDLPLKKTKTVSLRQDTVRSCLTTAKTVLNPIFAYPIKTILLLWLLFLLLLLFLLPFILFLLSFFLPLPRRRVFCFWLWRERPKAKYCFSLVRVVYKVREWMIRRKEKTFQTSWSVITIFRNSLVLQLVCEIVFSLGNK